MFLGQLHFQHLSGDFAKENDNTVASEARDDDGDHYGDYLGDYEGDVDGDHDSDDDDDGDGDDDEYY